jgi:hypothetical protein
MHDAILIVLTISLKGTSADAFPFCVYEASEKQKTEACCTDQTTDPRTRRTDVSSLWLEEQCWIYMIQDANGRLWGKSCRDLQIHHDPPD